MADGYDRFENEGGGGGSFVMGLLTGTVLGAGLGMLFAPKSGSELRNQLSEQAGNLGLGHADVVGGAEERVQERNRVHAALLRKLRSIVKNRLQSVEWQICNSVCCF